MQTNADSLRKGGVDDDKIINFRPSPNFCNMKRFLKKKIVDTCSINESTSVPADQQDLSQNSNNYTQYSTQVTEKKEEKPKIQPPLPLYPPPPDSPLPDLVKVKQEIEDYTAPLEDDSSISINQFSTPQPSNVTDVADQKPKKPICKDFIRGNCSRPQCRFAHELDLTQLEGIYTFCWNYQNSECLIPNCRYVHANPFEEGEFYRTGVLPPHALNHVKQQALPPLVPAQPLNMLAPPPPPPPPPPEDPPMAVGPLLFTNPPPPLYTPMQSHDKPMIMQTPPAVSEADTRGMDNFRMPHPVRPTPSASKRDWREMSGAAKSLITEFGEQPTECSSCADMEFRLQYNKAKAEKQMRSNKELEDKNVALEHKMSTLYSVLVTLLKPVQQAKSSTVTSLASSETEKLFLEHLSGMLNVGDPNNVR